MGDKLRVRPGDGVPVDGVVLEGKSAVDESMVTGESMPAAKAAGSKLIGGTVNGTGALVMRADKVGADTMLARIVAMVAEAQRSRAPIQRMADTVAGYFVPAVLVVAVLAFVAWSVWGPAPALSYALIAAVSVVIIACPCALGLATPMRSGSASAKGAGAGVLIKSAEALERMEKVDTLVVDKTGTLTEGRPKVTAMVPAPGFAEAEILTHGRQPGAVERASRWRRRSWRRRASAALAIEDPTEFASVTGKGVTRQGRRPRRGARQQSPMADLGIPFAELQGQADELRSEGATALFMAVDGKPGAVIAIADPIKATHAGRARRVCARTASGSSC